MIRILVFLIACLMVAVGPLSAGEPAADFSISASVSPSTVTPPGTEGVVTISITNLGPDDGTPLFSMQRTDDGSGFVDFPPLHFEFPGALLTGPCITVPVQLPPAGEFLIWIVPNMAAGENTVCTYAFTVAETSIITQVARWGVSVFSGPDDPNDANNVADVLLRFAELPDPEPIPLLSLTGMLVLVTALGWLAFHGAVRRST